MISRNPQPAALHAKSQTDSRRRARNLRGFLVQSVREAIMRGDYPPGSPLGEAELARRFGVSRGPVREALTHLERESLVRSFPNRGSFVTVLSEQDFDEIIMLRSVLEPIALQLAREKATAKDIAVLRQRLRDLEHVAAKRDQRAFIRRDYELHVAIWELTGRPLLVEVLKRVAAPVFVFEAILEERYRHAGYDAKADAHAHRLLIEYVAGKTDRDACTCLQPVLDVAMRAEKPIVFDRPSAPDGTAGRRPARLP